MLEGDYFILAFFISQLRRRFRLILALDFCPRRCWVFLVNGNLGEKWDFLGILLVNGDVERKRKTAW